jgi:hypothetical protein
VSLAGKKVNVHLVPEGDIYVYDGKSARLDLHARSRAAAAALAALPPCAPAQASRPALPRPNGGPWLFGRY